MNHIQAQELLPGYVLGALDTPERDALLAHILFCVSCYPLVQEHLEVGLELASGIPEAEAPKGLRNRIMAAFADKPVHLPDIISSVRWSGMDRRPRPWTGKWSRKTNR